MARIAAPMAAESGMTRLDGDVVVDDEDVPEEAGLGLEVELGAVLSTVRRKLGIFELYDMRQPRSVRAAAVGEREIYGGPRVKLPPSDSAANRAIPYSSISTISSAK